MKGKSIYPVVFSQDKNKKQKKDKKWTFIFVDYINFRIKLCLNSLWILYNKIGVLLQ